MKIAIASENSLIIYFGDHLSPAVSAQVQAATVALETTLNEVLIDVVPSYASLLVIYDIFKTDHFYIKKQITRVLENISANKNIGSVAAQEHQHSKLVRLPVYYSVESGPDIEALARQAKLTIEDVIDIHQQQEYRVYAIGFTPGFAYLGEVDERIAAARLATPRKRVPRGAVAIADKQTAIYPSVSPGGWNLIGLCPQAMFNPNTDPTMPVAVGDRVRFEAITREQYLSLGGELVSNDTPVAGRPL